MCKQSKRARGPRPPFVAETCAGQRRQGLDGRWYVSTINDAGQYVWVPAPRPALRRLASATRRYARAYGPAAAEFAAQRAADALHRAVLPAADPYLLDNAKAAWDHARVY
jgi:hypothetical protein